MRNRVLTVIGLSVVLLTLVGVERWEFPQQLQWSDRRPIASLVIATSAAGWPTNPRGWFLDPNVNVLNPEGIAGFQKTLLAWADRSIVIMHRMNAQGMITWDIEGEQFPHKTTYVGDPRMTDLLAPEMAGVADRYFQRFREAGFRVGVTIRPQRLDLAPDRMSGMQRSVPDPAAILIEKIRYAQRRWGASLFYIDSDGTPIIPMSPAVLVQVARAVPGVLLIPEHWNLRHYGSSAPYGSLRKGFTGTNGLARFLYPDGFSVIDTADGVSDGRYEDLKKAVRLGDILLFRGWFDDPQNSSLRKLARRSDL